MLQHQPDCPSREEDVHQGTVSTLDVQGITGSTVPLMMSANKALSLPLVSKASLALPLMSVLVL